MPIKLANNASGTLATAINASDTGIVLTTGDGAEFPSLSAGEYFYATITSTQGTQEIVKATARAGDSLTVVRAQEGTSAAGFSAGARFELRVTAASVDDIVEEVRTELAASSGASLVGFLQAGSGAVATTVQTKLRETVSVKDFGTVGNPTAISNALAATSAPINLNDNRTGGVQYAIDARSKKLRTLAGVIRQTAPDAGWEFITPAHDKLGFSGTITVDGNGDLVINFSFTATNVISFVAVPDEFYSSQGLKIGASVGLSSARLEAYADMSAVITPAGIAVNGSLGLADSVSATIDTTEGTVTVTHPTVYSLGSSLASTVDISAVNGTVGKSYGGNFILDSVTPTGFVLQRVTPLCGVVTTSASTPSVDTLCRGVSVAWDAANTCFVVTHPAVVSNDKHPVVSGMIRTPGSDTPYIYLPEFTTSTTETRVHVYNGITGAKITDISDNSMRFSFVRPNTYAKRPISTADATRFQVFRSNIPLNFNKVFATSGNIWLYGVMEEA